MLKKTFASITTIIILGALGFLVYAWNPELDPIDPPPASSFSNNLIEQGRILAGAGNCASCHTTEGGEAYAGGRAMDTGFGTIHSTNITPDPATGIGQWSETAFVRAMRRGVRRDGAHLFPAFPYTHFTAIHDDDLKALYAYFMTLTPVRAEIPDNTLPFPLNIRLLQAGWKLLFFDQGVFKPAPDKSDQWNRGAYLAEGLAHCSACHTPRNKLGAEKTRYEHYAGAFINGWYAPALTDANRAPLPWTEHELFTYLRTGATALHGVAGGSMSDVVHEGLARVADTDIRALAVYFADLHNAPTDIEENQIATAMAPRAQEPLTAEDETGARLYRDACAACHYNRKGAPLATRPELALNSAITGPDPTTAIRLILEGIDTTSGHPAAFMHGYDQALGDQDIAAILLYLHRRYATRENSVSGNVSKWQDIEKRVANIRQQKEKME